MVERAQRTTAAAPGPVCEEFLTSAAPLFNVGPVIGQNFISATSVIRKCTDQGTDLDYYLGLENLKKIIPSVERLHKRHRRISSGATVGTQWLRNCYLWQGPRVFYDCNCRGVSVHFCVFMLPAVCFPQHSGEAHIDHDSWKGACHNSSVISICQIWLYAACGGRMEKELLFTLPYTLYFFSCIPKNVIFFSYGTSFPSQPSATYSTDDNDVVIALKGTSLYNTQ